MVFAIISGFNKKKYNYRYTDVKLGFVNKELINPIPGRYQKNAIDPLATEKAFFPVFTDINGSVSFKDMYFSVFGPAGIIFIILIRFIIEIIRFI